MHCWILINCKRESTDQAGVDSEHLRAKSNSAMLLHKVDEMLEEERIQVLDYPDEYSEAVQIINFIAQQGLA